MMNNYDIAIDATKTAVTSHGSAMRENAEYLKSFEARINQLKVSFTEFAQAVGNAFLSGAMTGIIRGLMDLATAGAKVVEQVGALPPLLMAISLIAGRMGVFNNLLTKLGDIRTEFVKIQKQDGVGTFQRIGMAVEESGKKAGKAGGMFTGLGLTLKTIGLSFGIGLVLTGIGMLIEKIVKVRNEQKQLEKETKELSDNMISSYRSYSDGMEGVIDRYDELYTKQAEGVRLSTEEQQELAEVTSEIADAIPTATKYIDANGEAHLKTTEEIKRHVKQVEELSRAERELDIAKFNENMQEKANGYAKLLEDIEKTTNKISEINKKLEDESYYGGKNYEPKADYSHSSVGFSKESLDNMKSAKTLTKEMLEDQVQLMIKEAERTEHIQATLRLIESQTLGYFEVNGQLGKLGESQRGIIENSVAINEGVLRSAETTEQFMENTLKLEQFGKSVGNVFVEMYDEMERRAGGDPLKLEEMKIQMDAFAHSIPDDLFKIGDGKNHAEMDRLMKSIANVSEYVRLGHGDFDRLKNKLLEVKNVSGESILTNQEAGEIIHKLGRNFGNTAIDAEAFADEVYDAEEGLADFNSTALDTIDVVAELFGYTSEELTAISDLAGQMQTIKATYGDNYKDMELYKDIVQNIADITGNSIEKAEQYADVWGEVSQALQDLDATSGESFQSQINEMEDLSGKAKEAVLDIINNGAMVDAFNGSMLDSAIQITSEQEKIFKSHAKELGISYEDYLETTQGLYDEHFQLIIQEYGEEAGISIVMKNAEESVKKSGEEIEKSVDNISVAFAKEIEPYGVNKISEELLGAKASIDETSEKYDGLKTNLENPLLTTNSLDKFMEALEGTEISIGNTKDSYDDLAINLDKDLPTGGLTQFGSKVDDIVVDFEENINLMSITAGTIFEGVDFTLVSDKVKSAVTDAIELVNQLKRKIEETESIFDKMSKAIKDNKMLTDLENLLRKSEKVSEILDELKSKLDNLSKKNSLDKIRESAEKLTGALNRAKGEFDKLLRSVNSKGAFGGLSASISSVNKNLGILSVTSLMAKGAFSSFINVPTGNLTAHSQQLMIMTQNMIIVRAQSILLSTSISMLTQTMMRASAMAKIGNQDFRNYGEGVQSSFQKVSKAIVSTTLTLIREFNKTSVAVNNMRGSINRDLNVIVSIFSNTRNRVTNEVRAMTNQMRRDFESGMSSIASSAGSLPAKIGSAIRANMHQATGAMDSVAKNMVSRFKKELGIHSPSRVFEDLGGWVIKGLANGLTGADLKNLGKEVFSDFGGGAISSFQDMKDFITMSGMSPNFGGSFVKTSGFGMRVNPTTGVYKLHAGTDYGAPMGTPIRAQQGGKVVRSGYIGGYGNMVEISAGGGMTYRYAHNSRNMVKVGDTIKKGQIIGLVGSTGDSTGPHVHYEVRRNGVPINIGGKFAKGGIIDKHIIAEMGEEGPEVVIPLVSQRRERGLDLWGETGQLLGIDPELIKLLMPRRGSGGSSNSTGGSFGASTGDSGGGESGGGDSGSSGIMQESKYVGGTTFDGEYTFMSLAGKKSNLEELYKVNSRERRTTEYEGQLTLIEGKMKRINELSLRYRNYLKESLFYHNKILANNKKERSVLISRNKSIERQLKTLSKTSKHSEAQRKRYNKLQQEYDSNLNKINSLRSSIQSAMTTIKEESLRIFTNFVDEIVGKYDIAISKITKKVENIDFKISVMEFVEPDNIKGIVNAQTDKVHQLQVKQATAQNKINSLQKEYNKLQKKSSKEGKYLKEQLDNANKELQDITLAVLNAEKAVKDQRSKIADEGIKLLKEYYGNMRDMAIKAIDEEQKHSKKLHDDKMKRYDDEIKKINEIYDKKLKQIDKEESEDKYQEELHKKNEKRADLINKITLLSKDNSIEGKKRLSELEKELVEANEDIAQFQADRQKELLKEQIETQREAHLEGIESKKEAETTEHERYIEQLEAEKEAVQKKYDDIIENERYWAEMHEEFTKGKFEGLLTELDNMNKVLDDMGKGIFDGLTDSFRLFSDEVKAQVKEMNKLTVDNMKLISETVTANAKAIAKTKKMTESKGKTTTTAKSKATKVTTPKKTTTSKKTTTTKKKTTTKKSKAKKKAPKVGGKAKVSAKNANAYMDSYGRQVRPWSQQAKAAGVAYGASLHVVNERNGYVALAKKKGVANAIAWVKKKDVVGLKTGGMTPDNVPKSGAIALLHKKELVLNEKQTENYLDFAKLMDKIISSFGGITRANKFNTGAISNINNSESSIDYGGVNINIYDADKKKSKDIATEVLKKLDKKGI